MLTGRFAPRSDLSKTQMMRLLMSEKAWVCNTIREVPLKVRAWEKMQREFRARTGEDALSTWSRKQTFLAMLPAAVQDFNNTRSLYGQDLDYDQLKLATHALVQRTSQNVVRKL